MQRALSQLYKIYQNLASPQRIIRTHLNHLAIHVYYIYSRVLPSFIKGAKNYQDQFKPFSDIFVLHLQKGSPLIYKGSKESLGPIQTIQRYNCNLFIAVFSLSFSSDFVTAVMQRLRRRPRLEKVLRFMIISLRKSYHVIMCEATQGHEPYFDFPYSYYVSVLIFRH